MNESPTHPYSCNDVSVCVLRPSSGALLSALRDGVLALGAQFTDYGELADNCQQLLHQLLSLLLVGYSNDNTLSPV